MSTLKVNSIEPANAGSEDYFLARAWVNFNGTGTIAIRNDGNVSSLTDNTTGSYTVTFSASLSTADYSMQGTNGLTSSPGYYAHVSSNNYATSSVRAYVGTQNQPGATYLAVDNSIMTVTVTA